MQYNTTPPFNTGKVKIGLLYTPPMNSVISTDETAIQSALLHRSATHGSSTLAYWLYGFALSVFSVSLISFA